MSEHVQIEVLLMLLGEATAGGASLSFSDLDLARLLIALAVLLIAAHGMGSLFARFRHPPAIGEILGGIPLGPFGLAVACTSIPVMSRIWHAVGRLPTRSARIVLSAAWIEDIVRYVVLAVAVGLLQTAKSTAFGIPAALRIHTITQNSAYHTIVA